MNPFEPHRFQISTLNKIHSVMIYPTQYVAGREWENAKWNRQNNSGVWNKNEKRRRGKNMHEVYIFCLPQIVEK